MRLFALALALTLSTGCSGAADALRATLPTPTLGGASGGSDGSIPDDVARTDWSTTYGTMRLSPLGDGRVTAYYSGEGGTLDGAMGGDRYEGVWVEPNSARRCDSERRGSRHWGYFEFRFNPARDRFDGVWGYCDEIPERGWTGTRS